MKPQNVFGSFIDLKQGSRVFCVHHGTLCNSTKLCACVNLHVGGATGMVWRSKISHQT